MNEIDDKYDELLVLASDARTSRRRTTYWTTGLIVTGMVASTAYVGTVNQELDALKASRSTAATAVQTAQDAQKDAESTSTDLKAELSRLEAENRALSGERDAIASVAEWFSTMAPEFKVARAIERIVINTGGPGENGNNDFALSNLVWYVDGSRRFPMTARDILWIPEGRFWVRWETPANIDNPPVEITIFDGSRPNPDSVPTAGPFPLNTSGSFYERTVRRGGANCVRLERDNQTHREGFGSAYIDMIVTYSTKSDCLNNHHPGPPIPPENTESPEQ